MAQVFWDLQSAALVGMTVSPAAALTATGNGSSIDVSKCVGPINVLINCPTVTGTTPQAVFQLQYSANAGTTWTAVSADDNTETGTVTVTAAGQYVITSNETLGKLVRLSYTITGTTPSFLTDALVIGQLQKVGTGSGQQTNFTPGSGF